MSLRDRKSIKTSNNCLVDCRSSCARNWRSKSDRTSCVV